MVQYARSTSKFALLAEPFARDFLARRFGEDAAALILASVPRYTRGKHKGKPKGYITWTKVEVGGWSRGVGFGGGVLKPGTRDVKFCLNLGGLTFGERADWSSDINESQWLDIVRRGLTDLGITPAEVAA
jgi:hypothetical protein